MHQKAQARKRGGITASTGFAQIATSRPLKLIEDRPTSAVLASGSPLQSLPVGPILD
jgi:hypothetical protein